MNFHFWKIVVVLFGATPVLIPYFARIKARKCGGGENPTVNFHFLKIVTALFGPAPFLMPNFARIKAPKYGGVRTPP